MQRRLRDVELGDHLSKGDTTTAGNGDHVTPELGWELLGHGSIFPARAGLA